MTIYKVWCKFSPSRALSNIFPITEKQYSVIAHDIKGAWDKIIKEVGDNPSFLEVTQIGKEAGDAKVIT